MLVDKCYDVSTFERMFAGELPAAVAEKVCVHLEQCDRCFQLVRKLPEDTLVVAMRAQGKWPTTGVQPTFIHDLVQKVLKQNGLELPNPIAFACPGCGKKLQVKEELGGRKVKCPKCGQVVLVPAVADARNPANASATKEDAATLPPKDVRSSEFREASTLPPTNSNTPSSGHAEKSGDLGPIPDGRVLDDDGPLPRIPGYELLSTLGRGGMGVVYKARHQKLNRLVALKMILAGSHAGAAELARFQVEAEAIARLQHPNIVQVHEIGEHEGKPFFSLEFCGGGSVAQKLGGTPLPAKEAAVLVRTLARAMQAAHDQQIIHRDLKPANVLLTKKGIPKITDFGLAKKLDEAGQTQAGAVTGTPSYMAPEQAGGESSEVGPLADVYTLGAILYECLTGRPPFRAATSLETILQVTMDEPVPPSQLQSKTPKDIETICLKCLQKKPDKRYATAMRFAEDLSRFLKGEPVLARPVGRVERSWRWCRRNPVVAGLLATVAATFILGTVVAWGFALRADANARQSDANAKRAETNAERVEREKANVVDALEKAQKETKRAEDEKRLADKATKLAQEQTKRAEDEKKRAEDEKKLADIATKRARDNETKAEWRLYASQIASANVNGKPIMFTLPITT